METKAKLKSFLQRWIITTLAVLVAAHVVPGIHYDTGGGLLVATLLLVIVNVFVRPVMMVLSLPLLIFTLGLFMLVINALLLYFVGHLKNFHVDTFGAAFWGALLISIVTMILNSLTGTGDSRVQVKRGKVPSEGPRPNDKGPVIDI